MNDPQPKIAPKKPLFLDFSARLENQIKGRGGLIVKRKPHPSGVRFLSLPNYGCGTALLSHPLNNPHP